MQSSRPLTVTNERLMFVWLDEDGCMTNDLRDIYLYWLLLTHYSLIEELQKAYDAKDHDTIKKKVAEIIALLRAYTPPPFSEWGSTITEMRYQINKKVNHEQKAYSYRRATTKLYEFIRQLDKIDRCINDEILNLSCKEMVKHICDTARAQGITRIICMIGSARQDYFLDYECSWSNGTRSVFFDVDGMMHAINNDMGYLICSSDGVVSTDLLNDLPPRTCQQKFYQAFYGSEAVDHPREDKSDASKFLLYYLLSWYGYRTYVRAETTSVLVVSYDDRGKEIQKDASEAIAYNSDAFPRLMRILHVCFDGVIKKEYFYQNAGSGESHDDIVVGKKLLQKMKWGGLVQSLKLKNLSIFDYTNRNLTLYVAIGAEEFLYTMDYFYNLYPILIDIKDELMSSDLYMQRNAVNEAMKRFRHLFVRDYQPFTDEVIHKANCRKLVSGGVAEKDLEREAKRVAAEMIHCLDAHNREVMDIFSEKVFSLHAERAINWITQDIYNRVVFVPGSGHSPQHEKQLSLRAGRRSYYKDLQLFYRKTVKRFSLLKEDGAAIHCELDWFTHADVLNNLKPGTSYTFRNQNESNEGEISTVHAIEDSSGFLTALSIAHYVHHIKREKGRVHIALMHGSNVGNTIQKAIDLNSEVFPKECSLKVVTPLDYGYHCHDIDIKSEKIEININHLLRAMCLVRDPGQDIPVLNVVEHFQLTQTRLLANDSLMHFMRLLGPMATLQNYGSMFGMQTNLNHQVAPFKPATDREMPRSERIDAFSSL